MLDIITSYPIYHLLFSLFFYILPYLSLAILTILTVIFLFIDFKF